jgi:mRNA interferase RelE/StbE
MFKLDLTKSAISYLDKLPPKQCRQVARKIFSLLADPEPADSIQLKGYPFRRTDIGEYRIIYRREGETIKIPIINKRNDDQVYRALKRH